jgi:hypothetical protein
MEKNYSNLIQNVKNRTNPDRIDESILMEKSFSDELREITDKKVLEYIKRSMKGVEARYTERTIEAGNKVKNHLKSNNSSLDYKFQGSVPSNTHIKGHSDIDLVQITNSFYSHEDKNNFTWKLNTSSLLESQKQRLLEVVNGTPYTDDVNDDLRRIRIDAENVLKGIFKYVETTKPKSIEVNPTNPDRIVDVVTASWYKSVDSVISNDEDKHGIRIYDKVKHKRLPVDFPFLKIKLLNERDRAVNGRLKKMIRFLKNIKADSDYNLKDISSFDISSICYNIPSYKYSDKIYYELVMILHSEFLKILEDETYRNDLKSIDGSEPVFKGKNEKVRSLQILFRELSTIHNDLISQTSFAKFI